MNIKIQSKGFFVYNFEMQGSSFRKNKVGWIQETMRNLAASSLLCKPISHPQTPLKNSIFSLEVKTQEIILRPPDFSIRLDAKLVQRLQDRIQRSRKTVHGVLATNQITTSFDNFVELKTGAEEDIGSLQQAEGAFCVGIVLLKGEGDSDAARRLREQLRRCCQRGGAIFSSNSCTSLLPQIQKALVRQIRLFLLLQETREGLGVGQLLFFPRAHIPVKKIKLTPCSFTVNQILNHITTAKNIGNQINFGFITLSKSTQGSKFVLLDRNQPQLHRNCPPLLGVWAFGQVNGAKQKQTLMWSIIMEYVTNSHISQRLSFQGQRTGIFFFFDQRKNCNSYLFQFPSNATWSLVHNYQVHQRLPQQYHFSHQEVIHEEQREQSEPQSISKNRGQPFPYSQPSYEPGIQYQRQLEEKNSQIRRLTVELEFYKTQCSKLQQALANMNVFGITAKAFSGISPSMNPFSPKQVPSPMTSSFGHEAPFFGNRQADCMEFEIQQPSINRKQFAVKDLKNISFAQQNQFEEEFTSNSQKILISPQFKEKQVIIPHKKKEIEEKEEFRVMKQKSSEYANKLPQQQLGSKSHSITETRQQKKDSQLKLLEDKYGNNTYERTSKVLPNNLKGKELANITQNDNFKNAKQSSNITKRQQQSRVNTFQQNPRQKRIKNQMYSQQKINKISKAPDAIEKSPLKGRFKEEQKNAQKDETKTKQTLNSVKTQHRTIQSALHNSSDEDEQLKDIIKQKNLEKKRKENKER